MGKKVVTMSLLAGLAMGCDAPVQDELTPQERVAEITENLLEAGFGEDEITVVEAEDEFSIGDLVYFEAGPRVYLQGDQHVTLEASREMVADDDPFRHWVHSSLVTNNMTICLIRPTALTGVGPSQWVPPSYDQYLGMLFAMHNYNALNTGLTFAMRTGLLHISGSFQITSQQAAGCNAFIGFRAQSWMPVGGVSGLPSGGMPYPVVTLFGSSTDNQLYEHIATHEIGHAIGFRHSDWLTRESCGAPVQEGWNGAQLIPGTAFNTTNSIMAACTPAATNGEFRGDDVTALEHVY